MLGWLNDNQGAVVAVANVLLVIFTAVSVGLTRRAIRQTRSALVGASIVPLEVTYNGVSQVGGRELHDFEVHVVNVGNGPAVRLSATLAIAGVAMEPQDARFGPSDIPGVAQAHEPKPETQVVPVRGFVVSQGSALEDRFVFFAPGAWQPPERGRLACTVQVSWYDTLGRHEIDVDHLEVGFGDDA